MKVTDILALNVRETESAKEKSRRLIDGILHETARTIPKDSTLSDAIQTYTAVMEKDICTPEFIRFCEYLYGDNRHVSYEDFLPEPARIGADPPISRIAYQKNPYSDRAFTRLTDTMPGADAVCLPTTASVCEEIYYGRCTHCILPIYSSADGILTAFTKLIDKYDLVINAACDVSLPDGDSIMRFALLRHELSLPNADHCYVQINAVLPPSASLAMLLGACESIGASVSEMITNPLAYTTSNVSYTIRLRVPLKRLTVLLVFLRSVLDNYTLEGIFTIIQ
ncbi:MAG: hypothetical protein IIW82_07550 [Clostridia bacterium]|nr:hypothetical protein [Clostridia bacterium]